MRNVFIIVFVLTISAACKKEAGPGGKNFMNGTVLYKNGASGNNDAASGATVQIAYGTNAASSEFDQTVLTNASGKFNLGGLQKGKYFLKASFIDSHGFIYSTPGYAVEIEKKKSTVEVNMILE